MVIIKKKKIIFILVFTLLIISILFVFGYFCIYVNCSKNPKKYTQTKYNYSLSDKYKEFRQNIEDVAIIPGLKEHIIPQGLTYSSKYNKFLIVAYHKGKASSVIFIIDPIKKDLEKTLLLQQYDSKSFNTHIGGITTDDETIWLSDNYMIYTLSLSELLKADDMSNIRLSKPVSSLSKGDYITYHDGFLWIGEYDYKFKYETLSEHYYKDNKSLIAVFDLKKGYQDYLHPEFLLSVPDRIQGLNFDEEDNIVLSRSFWSFQSSDLSIYKNILDDPSENIEINGDEYQLWYLDNSHLIKNIVIPPMSEGIYYLDNEIYIIFESAASFYRIYTRDKVDSIVKLKKW